MPFFELPNGKTIFLSAIELLDLTDEKIQEFMADDRGEYIDNPFHKSPNRSHFSENQDTESDSLPENEIESILKEIEDTLRNGIKKK